MKDKETAEHVLCKCHAAIRIIQPEDMEDSSPKRLIDRKVDLEEELLIN